MLSVIVRLFEKIVHQQLYDFLKESLSVTQSGFKPGCSTETSLLNTTNHWNLNIDKKYLNLTLFLDLRKAFDTVTHEILIQKMDFYGIKGIELAWFKSYLSNRMQYCCIDGTNSDYKVNPAGVSQGSCLGPLLFLIYINDLPSVLLNSDSNLYADDINISTAEELLLKAQENLNTDIKTQEQWLDANKLSLSLVKTEYMIIASSPELKHIDFSPLIKLAGKPIKHVLKTDYLGLIIHEKLSWVDYISTLTKKISSAVAAIKNVNFLPCKTLITLYESLVESRLRYCNTVWGNCGLTLKNKLQSLQNRAARVVTWTKYGCVEPDQLLKNLRWLNVQQLIDFDTAVMVHKSINNKAPPYLTSLFSKSSSVHNHDTRTANLNLFPTHTRLKFGQKCFSHYGSHLWNKLDRDVQAIDCTEKFKIAFPTMDVINGTSWTGMFKQLIALKN